jgi:uncharacterized membrane protein HdeD (DUF308 family)
MVLLLLGASAMASFTIGLFFLRFRRTTRDRFFLYFAAAFFIEGIERIVTALFPDTTEREPLFYLMRLLSFLIILYAISEKNGLFSGRKRKP